MTPNMRRPPSGPPPSAGVLAQYARAYAREAGVSDGRVRAWIAYMIMAGLLEHVTATDGPRFTIKGGVALELRLRARARATKDIDIVLQESHRHRTDDGASLPRRVERTLEHALTTEAYQGFTFRRKGEPVLLDNGTMSLEFAVSYRGSAWTSIVVDVAQAEPSEGEIELVPAIALTEAFGVTGPTVLPCLPLRLHIAQKIHGMTLPPRPGKRNERFRDLIDLLLMQQLVTDYRGLREACETVFHSRATHAWPPTLAVPSHWVAPFARLAQELELEIKDAESAMEHVRAFVSRILQA